MAPKGEVKAMIQSKGIENKIERMKSAFRYLTFEKLERIQLKKGDNFILLVNTKNDTIDITEGREVKLKYGFISLNKLYARILTNMLISTVSSLTIILNI